MRTVKDWKDSLPPPGYPQVHISQVRGEVSLTVHCTCGDYAAYEGEWPKQVQCQRCGATWVITRRVYAAAD